MAFAGHALAFLLFVVLALVLPGIAVLRALSLRPEAALVLPTGLVVCAASALVAAGTGWGALFPVLLLGADAALLVTAFPVPLRAERLRALGALAPVGALGVLLLATRWWGNRILPSGDFLVDSLNWQDVAFHVGLVRELTVSFPPQVPGLAGVPLSYHFGLDLVRAAALRFAGVDPYDLLTRFEPLLWATALVLALRAVTALLGGGRLAVAAVGFTLLAGDFSFVWAALAPIPHYWIDYLRGGNLFLAVVDANSSVPSLAVLLGVVLALGRRAAGGSRGYVALATLLALALPGLKVFAAAHLALGLGVAFLLVRERRDLLPPILATGAVLAALVVVEGPGQVGARAGSLLMLPASPTWLASLPPALGHPLWLLLWLCASLGLRLVGLPRALGALRGPQAAPIALATMALSGWPLGLLFDVSALNRLPKERFFNEAGYFIEQAGALLWIFAVLALAALARRLGPRVLVVAAAVAFPATLQFVPHYWTRPPVVIPGAVLDAMRALERDSRPGDVVLQRPHPRWPPPPVVFASRRVPLTRIYPYLSQFLGPAEILDRQRALRDFFATTDPKAALLVARRFGATHAVAYEDDVIASGARAVLQPVFENPAVRVYRVRYE
ncbi:MAG TPA: hypothetical protein VL691_05085 [Vicinamibacteria bacterium]|nr:hypothetical protein [Vicinamibacteria bacterium]